MRLGPVLSPETDQSDMPLAAFDIHYSRFPAEVFLTKEPATQQNVIFGIKGYNLSFHFSRTRRPGVEGQTLIEKSSCFFIEPVAKRCVIINFKSKN